jgi:hypothetical protein
VSYRVNALPDMTRSDAVVALFDLWDVGTHERQRATVDAIITVWDRRAWPTPDLLSYSVFASTDGGSMLTYSQWAADAGSQDLARAWKDEIDVLVPGNERTDLIACRYYRSHFYRSHGAGTVEWPPAHMPFVVVELDGNNPRQQQDWVDTMLTAHLTDPDPPAGEITVFFHLSADGTRILHIGEWTSAQAHREAYTRPGWGVGSATPEWEFMRNYPGFVNITGNAYRHELHLAAPRGIRSPGLELSARQRQT